MNGSRTVTQICAWAGCVLLLSLAFSQAIAAEAGSPPDPTWRTTVNNFAREKFRHPAWGYSHAVRDYRLARALAAEDHVAIDDDVLYAAAYLHDMAAFAPWDREKEGIDHADEAARVVDTVLRGTGFPMAKIDAVRAAITTHMYERTPTGAEARYLHDADALDWLGAIGVVRTIALIDSSGGDPDGPKAVAMLKDYLTTVPPRVFTTAGKRRLPVRRAELATFLRNLDRESDSLAAL